MPRTDNPDLSHLSGAEIEKVAKSIASANLKTIIENRDALVGLKTEELQKLVDLASASRANCGGLGCG